MVHIAAVVTTFLTIFATADACAGWYQCKYSNGAHCCVVDNAAGPGACPSRCNGGSAWPPQCVSQTTGNLRTQC